MTFTHLALGEPRLKGTPRGDPPCIDPDPRQGEWSIDGSFENPYAVTGISPIHPGELVVWPTGSYFGRFAFRNFPTSTNVPVPFSYVASDPRGDSTPDFSTANPRTGASHIREEIVVNGSIIFTNALYFASFVPCLDVPFSQSLDVGSGSGTSGVSQIRGPVMARCLAGDLVSASLWLYNHDAADAFSYRWGFRGLDNNPSPTSSLVWSFLQTSVNVSTTGSWVELSGSTTVPSNSWVAVRIVYQRQISGVGINTWTVDFDDLTVEVS